ncbi:hypothetical protein Tsubulata_002841 [Turnera subulata]|uniref:DUF7804 domain-containing protein n=1 Tax=Turnera subulata TaxID=218843 RepID=A0A9Q0EYN7_9ROSI|nr:hypothetical protein Tsubulata_002841 [Turnera subulata]
MSVILFTGLKFDKFGPFTAGPAIPIGLANGSLMNHEVHIGSSGPILDLWLRPISGPPVEICISKYSSLLNSLGPFLIFNEKEKEKCQWLEQPPRAAAAATRTTRIGRSTYRRHRSNSPWKTNLEREREQRATKHALLFRLGTLLLQLATTINNPTHSHHPQPSDPKSTETPISRPNLASKHRTRHHRQQNTQHEQPTRRTTRLDKELRRPTRKENEEEEKRKPPTAATVAARRSESGGEVAKREMVVKEEEGKRTEAEAVVYERMDQWMRDSVGDIVKNLKEAPLLVQVYSNGEDQGRRPKLETERAVEEEDWPTTIERWQKREARLPEGVIFVERLEEDNVAGGEDDVTRA